MRIRRWRSTVLLVTLTAVLAHGATAFAVVGALNQLATPDACVSDDGTSGNCEDGTALFEVRSVVASPDGKHVYAATNNGGDGTVVTLSRDKTTGDLDMVACVSDSGSGTCDDGVGLVGARNVAISPDGKNVYVASGFDSAVASFKRNANTGILKQLTGTKACISEDGTGGACADGNALGGAEAVTVSKDGTHVYVASGVSNAVVTLKRNTTNGKLSQGALPGSCVSEGGGGGCTAGAALKAPFSVAISKDGKSVYIAAGESEAVSAFKRNKRNGKLTQLPGVDGCVSESGSGGCENGSALNGIEAVIVSPDGENVYTAADGGVDGVAAFTRNTSTGALDQLTSTDACVSEGGAGGCESGVALSGVRGLGVSNDSTTIYVAAGASNAVVALSRDASTGDLDPIAAPDGCVSDDGTTGSCENGVALLQPESVTVTKDGNNVYVGAQSSNAVAALTRSEV